MPIVAIAASWAAAAAPEVSTKTLDVGGSSVVVDWASGWEVDSANAGLPASSAAFHASDATKMRTLLTTGPVKDEISTDEGIKKIVSEMAAQLESQSVEKKVEVQRIAAKTANGYYVCATDRAPKPGEYKYLCQGLIRLGETPFVFTILYSDSGKSEADKVIAAMKTLHLAQKS
jgi:hypothetical protein